MSSRPQDDWELHWDNYAESTEYNPAQIYRRHLILSRLGPRVERIVDIGSGQGDLAKDLTVRFPSAQVLGLEMSLSGVKASEEKAPAAVFLQRDLLDPIEDLGAYSAWATHGTCSEVLEHVDDPVMLLRQGQRYLAPGARLIVTVPGGPMSAFDRHIGHRRHYSEEALRGLLESVGFVVDEVARAGFPFFNLYRLVVVLRGERLVEDVSSAGGAENSPLARLVMGLFRYLFRFNRNSTPWGWQLVARAHLPQNRR